MRNGLRSHGGSQQRGMRPGTEAVGALIAAAAALEDAVDPKRSDTRTAKKKIIRVSGTD